MFYGVFSSKAYSFSRGESRNYKRGRVFTYFFQLIWHYNHHNSSGDPHLFFKPRPLITTLEIPKRQKHTLFNFKTALLVSIEVYAFLNEFSPIRCSIVRAYSAGVRSPGCSAPGKWGPLATKISVLNGSLQTKAPYPYGVLSPRTLVQ